MGCTAYRMNDQMRCDKCGIQWDINDPAGCRSGTKRAAYVEYIAATFGIIKGKRDETRIGGMVAK